MSAGLNCVGCSVFSQAGGMDEVAFQDFERGCVTEKEPTHLPLGCSIKRLVKVSKSFPPFHVKSCSGSFSKAKN